MKKKKHRKIKNKPVICPYCGTQAILRPGSYLFENPKTEHLYVCTRYPECGSYVAAHKINLVAMGMHANAELRHKRHEAHLVFDQLWKSGIFTRNEAYSWMADLFFIRSDEVHIGNFNMDRCNRLIKEAGEVLRNRRECHKKEAM